MEINTPIESEVEACVDAAAEALPAAALAEVRHYLAHGEHEMAFEGLVLELISCDCTPKGFDAPYWLDLAERLGLRGESVFVDGFWDQLTAWAESR